MMTSVPYSAEITLECHSIAQSTRFGVRSHFLFAKFVGMIKQLELSLPGCKARRGELPRDMRWYLRILLSNA